MAISWNPKAVPSGVKSGDLFVPEIPAWRPTSPAETVNHAIVLMALFLGEMDFRRTIRICINSVWDTDCTAATTGALLGAPGGTQALPAEWPSLPGRNPAVAGRYPGGAAVLSASKTGPAIRVVHLFSPSHTCDSISVTILTREMSPSGGIWSAVPMMTGPWTSVRVSFM